MYEIYLITNQINEKRYVGQTVQGLSTRFRDHIRFSKRGSDSYLHQAMGKYGHNRFTINLLATAKDQEELARLEIFWIKTLKTKSPSGYNLTEGGEGCSGFIRSDENRQKMSLAMKGKLLGRFTGEESPHFLHNLDLGRIESLYQQGKSFVHISKIFGVSVDTIKRRFKSSGIAFRSSSESKKMLLSDPENHPMYREDLSTKDMVSLLERRFTYQEIADKMGCSLGCVRERLKKDGISNLHNRTRINKEDLICSYLVSKSVKKVAEEFAISTTTVHRVLTREGVPRLGRQGVTRF